LLIGCNFDRYSGQRPYDYESAKWECEKISAYVYVDLDSKKSYEPIGKILIDGQTMVLHLIFVNGTNQVLFSVYETEEDAINNTVQKRYGTFDGECEFYEDKMVVHIMKDRDDTVFNYRYSKLVFCKTEK